ncbi:hypothetical protein Dhaf_2890 [Desulfitobacterium hafniense DCB-2]|uniref:Uncharacterized protein n=1 Tax=Desulfitobacterium hafniense (strain DSM 10664 / DCB-2) TaxID=272564 RepID=B8FXJ4_DESHD|nr:hypothetical protein [Desulfitobacterium hafniense]ACL20913.1 hypothetical protein Dhaf_2890 [Desulfitobacterium hafniense DCB-2]
MKEVGDEVTPLCFIAITRKGVNPRLTEAQKRAYIIVDNRLAMNAGRPSHLFAQACLAWQKGQHE